MRHRLDTKHVIHRCTGKPCNSCQDKNFKWCEVCLGNNRGLATHCPGRKVTIRQLAAIGDGDLDFYNGHFIDKTKR